MSDRDATNLERLERVEELTARIVRANNMTVEALEQELEALETATRRVERRTRELATAIAIGLFALLGFVIASRFRLVPKA